MNRVQALFISELIALGPARSFETLPAYIDSIAERASNAKNYPDSLVPFKSKESFVATVLVMHCAIATGSMPGSLDLSDIPTLMKFGATLLGSEPFVVALRRALQSILNDNDPAYILNIIKFVKDTDEYL